MEDFNNSIDNDKLSNIFKKCINLKKLYIGGCIYSLQFINTLINLQELDIDLAYMELDISDLKYLINLKVLHFRHVKFIITDFSVLSSLTNLEHISLNCVNISDLSCLYNLPKLTGLHICFGTEQYLKDLTQLTMFPKCGYIYKYCDYCR